jgi:hypothetical protein
LAPCKLDPPYLSSDSRMLIRDINRATVATVARFILIRYLTTEPIVANVDLIIWTQVEVGIALIASSAATLRPLITQAKSWASHLIWERSNEVRDA